MTTAPWNDLTFTKVIIESGVTSVGYCSFYGCDCLTNVIISSGTTTICGYAFCNCTGLTAITVPASVTKIDYSILDGCSNFRDVYYGGTAETKSEINISGVGNEILKNATWHYATCATTGHVFCGSEAVCYACGTWVRKSPDNLSVVSHTDSEIEVTTIENAEYSLDELTWQTSPVFTGLTPAKTYKVYARYAGNGNTDPGRSCYIEVTLDKGTREDVPNAPTVTEITENTVTLQATEGCEYSVDGTAWQTSNVFADLESDTEYTFYRRYRETDCYNPSAKSPGTTVKTAKEQDIALGDMNGDGEANSDDAIYLLKYIFKAENYPVATGLNPNCNGDSEVNSDDAIYLLKYVFKPENYPLAG